MKIKTEEIGGSAPVNNTSGIDSINSKDPTNPPVFKTKKQRKPEVLRRIVPHPKTKAHILPVSPKVH